MKWHIGICIYATQHAEAGFEKNVRNWRNYIFENYSLNL